MEVIQTRKWQLVSIGPNYFVGLISYWCVLVPETTIRAKFIHGLFST